MIASAPPPPHRRGGLRRGAPGRLDGHVDPAAPPADAVGTLRRRRPRPSSCRRPTPARRPTRTSPPTGSSVAFASTADDLGAADTNGVADVFLSTAIRARDDPFSGAAELVSAPDPSSAWTPANDASSEPVVSADGRYVAFTSEATNLVTRMPHRGVRQVYVRDRPAGTTFRLQGAAEPDGDSYDPDISDDGRYVVFTSDGDQPAPDDATPSRHRRRRRYLHRGPRRRPGRPA